MTRLDDARARVDAIDRAIVKLLAERRAAVAEAAEAKRTLGLPAIDPQREQALAAQWTQAATEDGLPPPIALAVLEAILRESRKHVRSIKTRG